MIPERWPLVPGRFLLLSGFIYYLFFVTSAFASPTPMRLGATLGLTGPADRWSKFQRMGMELALEDLRAEGHVLELLIEDSASEPVKAVTNFSKFVSVDRVDAVLGDIFSYVTDPMLPLATKHKKLLISPSTPASFCERSKGFFFSTATQVHLAIDGFRIFLDLHPEVKRVALVYFQDPGWGYQYRDGWKRLAASRGITVTGEYESAEFFPDFKTPIAKLLQQKPDAFFVAHQPKTFIPAARQLAFKGSFVFANNVLEIPASGPVTEEVNGVYFVDTLAPEPFQARFQKKFGEPPLLEAYNGYEALRLAVKALVANPEAPEKAIPGLKYEGVTGPMDFTASCAGNRSAWHLKQFQGGKIVNVPPR